MQNNGASVGLGDGFDVRIVWRKGYDANNVLYYDLLTYMEEKDSLYPQNIGPLLLRDSMRFNSLSEVIEGLEVDENCQALVTGGITSATCSIPNCHRVNFVKLEATGTSPQHPVFTALILKHCDKKYDEPLPIVPNFFPEQIGIHQTDTILQPIDITDCYGVSNQTPQSDTIKYTISCEDVQTNYYCDYFFELYDIPDSVECKYYFNDTLIDSVIYEKLPWSLPGNSHRGKFPLDRQYFANDSSANIKIIVNGIEYNFKIFVEDNTIDGAEQLAQLPNIQLDKEMRTATLILDTDAFSQSIKLPDFGCSYKLDLISYYDFVTLPTIDSNNVLHFELKPSACSAEFYMSLQCECDRLFTFLIENPNCKKHTDCNVVTITTLKSRAGRDTTKGDPMRHMRAYGVDPIQNNITHSLKTSTGNHDSIMRVTVNEITTQTDSFLIQQGDSHRHITPSNDTTGEVSINFAERMCEGYVTAYYEICTEFKNGTICCNTFSFDLACSKPRPKPDNGIAISNELKDDNFINYILLDEPLFNSPIVPPLYVKVFDGSGTQLITTLHSSVPTSLTGSISYGHLPVGMYNIVFQGGDYIETIQVISSGTDR